MTGRREVLELPTIARGLATRLGQVMIGVLAVATAVLTVVDDEGAQAAVAMGGTVLTAVTLMAGRYAQSCALLKQVPSPVAARADGTIGLADPATTPTAAATSAPTQVVVHCCHCQSGAVG